MTGIGRRRRRVWVVLATSAALGLTITQAQASSGRISPFGVRELHQQALLQQQKGLSAASATGEDEGGDEAMEEAEQADQYAEARTSPGIVAPGAYGAAYDALKNLPHTHGGWDDVTRLPYDADDPRYRDINSNSSGGAGRVTGRVTGLAADNHGYVYAGSANGGVFRSHTGGGRWTNISDRLPALSTGDLQLDGHGRLWYATGEANTSATSFLGTGVYVLDDPRHDSFGKRDRVGGDELESTSINALRFAGDKVWAATTAGVWSHSAKTLKGHWKLEFAPNPDYLPGGSKASDPSAPYKNITSDIAVDPKDPGKVVLAVGWRGGDTYNGFYAKSGGSWQRLTGLGDLPSNAEDVGNVTFARSADGSRYYAIDQSPEQTAENPDSGLEGIFVSKSGSPTGPWTRIATYQQLRDSGSALTGAGYQPGIQAWYNQFLTVDPKNPDHVYAGLEEVFETKDGGKNWSVPGPYWNFGFPCWSIDPSKQTGDCHQTVHADQHSVAIGSNGGAPYVVVGDDGGAFRRPLYGSADASGHATDWKSLNDGTMDALQYYSVGVGVDPSRKGLAVTGGLQDNGQSQLRPGDRVMGSNFGGDGGDTITDPANGCNIAQEYVYLAVSVTNNCAVNDGSWVTDPSKATTYSVAPPDNATSEARFIAPLNADIKDAKTWVAGGRHVWINTKGYAIRSGTEWLNAYDLGAGHTATAVASSGGRVYAAWCGPCNNQGFTRGIAVGNADGTGWHQLNLPADGTVPNRYLSGLAIDPKNADHVLLAVNGFSRKWTEGPGAGVGHLFETRDGGLTWKDVSGNLPDVPANSVALLRGGTIALGTDLGVLVRTPGSKTWRVAGDNLPTTAVMQLRTGPDGRLYAATHGRGIWAIDTRKLR
ncbi:glycosyl hydrolase [Streptomyces panaciradicis]|uniref:glycosyl hydrolase n=1 Tax=Streptomyces panaciradicis TaxID=1470261 RepID=UPI00201D0A7E|nr:glycosyl hydrolase [Streptomyces panaciradicis]MCL6668444.1 glycosyl hydrolase [Streptomyces panaciradicis]